MNELIQVQNGTPLLDPLTALMIAEYEQKIRQMKELEDHLKESILAEMESKNIIKLENEFLTITYVAPTDRETLDTKNLRAELPDIYDEYIKITPVKASVRIKVKDNDKVGN